MKNLRIAIASILATSVLLSNAAFAEIGDVDENGAATTDGSNIDESDVITLSFNHPQSLAVSAPNNVTERASGGIINRTWHVVSNNAVKVEMTGKSIDDDGVANATPVFYKQEVDSSGDPIANRFDTLLTSYGITVDGQNDLTGTNVWGGGASAADVNGGVNDGTNNGTADGKDYDAVFTGTPANLVATDLTDTLGTIMPSDDGNFNLKLSAKGVGDVATTQSGDYQVTIVASFMADEQGNGIVTASSVDLAPDDNSLLTTPILIAASDLESDAADNTNWNNTTTSLAVDGTTEQSPDIIQTDEGLSASNATYY